MKLVAFKFRNSMNDFPFLFLMGATTIVVNSVTLRSTYFGADGGGYLYGYGFPRPWLCASLASSGQFDVQLRDFTLNWGLVFVGVTILWIAIRLSLHNWTSSRWLQWTLRICGGFVLAAHCFFAFGLWYPVGWNEPLFDEGWLLTEPPALHLGWGWSDGPSHK